MKFRALLLFGLSLTCIPSAQAQPKALAELFSNTDCANCRTPDDQFTSYLSSHPDVVAIIYHNNSPSPTDVFYLAGKPSTTSRNVFYSGGAGLSDPTTFIDGYFSGSGQLSEPQWETVTNASPPLTPIAVTKSVNTDGIITINFTAIAQNLANVFVALKESNIIYHNTGLYGAMPGDLWNNIFRIMLPTATGSAQFSGPKTFAVTYDPSLNPDWITDNMAAVVFVQDATVFDTKHSYPIEALGTISLGGGNAVSANSQSSAHLRITANPTARLSQICFEIPEVSRVRITLADVLGRSVQTLVDGSMPSGQSSIEIEGTPISSGCYFVRMFVDGTEVDRAKVIVE